MCENVPLGSFRRCIIHQDSSVCLYRARLRPVTHSQPANSLSALQLLQPTTSIKSHSQLTRPVYTCFVCGGKRTSAIDQQVLKSKGHQLRV